MQGGDEELHQPKTYSLPWACAEPERPRLIAVVLLAAALHASWNALIKSSSDKPLDTAWMHFLAAWLALPFMLWVGPAAARKPAPHGGVAGMHVATTALTGAYQHGELG